jgi:hypothetical protein
MLARFDVYAGMNFMAGVPVVFFSLHLNFMKEISCEFVVKF